MSTFDHAQHSELSMAKMEEHLKNGKFCDVVLIANEKRIPAHKLVLSSTCDYFNAMFNYGVRESEQNEIRLQNISGDILQELVSYMYSGKFDIREDNVEQLLAGANLLQLHRVVDECCRFMEDQLHPSNCLGIRMFADTYSCGMLRMAAHKFVMDNFTKVTNTQEFQMLTLEQMKELLANDDINVPSEQMVYQAMMQWLQFDIPNRTKMLPSILPHIRVEYIDREFIGKEIVSNSLLANDLDCHKQLVQALMYQALPERWVPPHRMRKSTIGMLYAMGGMDSLKGFSCATTMEKYDPRTDKWIQISSMTSRRLQFGVAVVTDKMYIVGGRDGLKTLNTVECFDGRKEDWTPMPPIATHRHGLAVAMMGGPLYAVGGHDGWSYLNTVERWDPSSRIWTYVAPMNVSRSTLGAAVLNGKLYAIGGRDGSSCLRSVESFDPHTNRWSPCAPMAKRRGMVGVGVCNGQIYAIGGHDAPSSSQISKLQDTVECYNTTTNQWTTMAPMTVPRDASGIAVIGDMLYACGGYDGQKYLTTCERYVPQNNEWQPIASLNIGRAGPVIVHMKNIVAATDVEAINMET